LIYLRLNPRTHTPFGLGRLEVAFETINAFLGANRHAAKLASNSVVQYALWLRDLAPSQHERLIRWWQDDIEGTGRVPLLSTEEKPEVLRFAGGTDGDLYLEWQQFLLRLIANAFDLPPFFLGLEHDVNRATADAALRHAFTTAVVPTARLFAEHITRDAIAKKLGWHDLEFVFTDLDAEDPREQAELDEILIRSGILTVNEARAARGLTPIQ
jgi:phage portal protein BeeE